MFIAHACWHDIYAYFNQFLIFYNLLRKGEQFFLGTQILLGPLRSVTRVKHWGMSSPWEMDSWSRDPPTDPSRIAQGLYSGTIEHTRWLKDQAEPEHALGLCSGLMGSPNT